MGELSTARRSAGHELSAAHYLELWHRHEQRSREEVGTVMRDVTGYATIPSTRSVRRREVRALVSQLVGRSSPLLATSDLLGHGAAHAFDSPHGRFRFIESLASLDGKVNEGPATEPPENWTTLDRTGPKWEWLQLVGTQLILESEGVERTPEHRYGTRHVEGELLVREHLVREPNARGQLWDHLVADEFESLRDEIDEISEELNVEPRAFFFSGILGATPSESVHGLVARLPSAFAWATLRHWKHRDLTHPWEQHDWTDISALSVAVPHCDVVITGRGWAHMIKATRPAERHDTEMGYTASRHSSPCCRRSQLESE